jgi:hypothetical protein
MRTAAHDSMPPWGRCRRQKVILNQCSGNEVPRAWPDETARRGDHGSVSRGTDMTVDVTEGGLTPGASIDMLKTARQSPIRPC